MLKELVGKSWTKEQNCYTLIREYYKDVALLPYITFAMHQPKFFLDISLDYGFKQVNSLEIDDCIITNAPVHLIIYIGNNKILHHPLRKLSLVEYIDDSILNNIYAIVRRKKDDY